MRHPRRFSWQILPRLAIAGLFLAAALPKLRDPAAFVVAVDHYRLFPTTITFAVGMMLPWLELVVAIALLVKRRVIDGAWLLAGVLTLLFVLAEASAWLRGLDISCGCFGNDTKITGASVGLRAGLFIFTVWAWKRESTARYEATATAENTTTATPLP